MSKEQDSKIAIVYCVTSFGKIVGVYASSEDAFVAQMALVNKGRIAELVPSPIIYSLENGFSK